MCGGGDEEQSIEALSGLDATFLYLESPTTHLHVGLAAVFDGSSLAGAAAYPRVAELVEARLHLIPPFQRRLFRPMGGALPPVWIHDLRFRLEDHLIALPPRPELPDSALAAVAADIMRQPLKRDRPLWEMYVVQGRNDNRVALIAKIHHASIDGVSGLELLANLVDIVPQGREVSPPQTVSAPAHGEITAALGWGGAWLATQPRRARQVAASTASWVRAARRFEAPGQTLGSRQPQRPRASRTALTRPITDRRAVSLSTLPMSDVELVRKSLGGTVNDVVLAVCAGALRAYLVGRGDDPNAALVASVPMSQRRPEQAGKTGNAVSALLVPLATELDDPRQRYDRIVAHTRTAKEREAQLRSGELLSEWVTLLGPVLSDGLGWLGSRVGRVLAAGQRQLAANVIISNIPGPPLRVYAAGLPLTAAFPLGPIHDGVPLNITVLSYGDSLHVGLLACPGAVPDIDRLARYFPDALNDLCAQCD